MLLKQGMRRHSLQTTGRAKHREGRRTTVEVLSSCLIAAKHTSHHDAQKQAPAQHASSFLNTPLRQPLTNLLCTFEMHCSIAAAIAALLVPAALAVPFNSMRLAARQLPPSTNVLNPDFPIHDSEYSKPTLEASHSCSSFLLHAGCNASQQLQLKQGFADMKLFAQSALDHLLHYGHTSDLAKLYFGNETNVTPAIGAYVRLLSADKAATLFR